jgi:hypothetical protein
MYLRPYIVTESYANYLIILALAYKCTINNQR